MNENPVDPDALEVIRRLTRFWTLKRKSLAAKLTTYLQGIHDDLSTLSSKNDTLSAQYAAEQNKSHLFVQANKKERDRAHALQSQLHASVATVRELNEQIAARDASIEAANEAYDALDARRVAALTLAKEDLAREQKAHKEETERFDLVRSVLMAMPPTSEEWTSLEKLVREDYMDFAERESSLAGEAQAALALHAILEELSILVGMPKLAHKTKVAVAGGFSAGKSAFINSLIGQSGIKLAEGINPVTSIPSYVIQSENLAIKGYSTNGGLVEIEPSLYAKFGHEYFESFQIDLRQVMPFISVETPMQFGRYEHICFVDTPGYDAGVSGMTTGGDRSAAQKILAKSHAVIWVIDIQKGTFNSDALDFITQILNQDKKDPLPLYVVLNKADIKSDSEIEDVLREIATTLEDEDIDYRGICAYSSINPPENRMLSHLGDVSLNEFLSVIDTPANVVDDYHARISEIFTKYRVAIQLDQTLIAKRKNACEAFMIDLIKQEGSSFAKTIKGPLQKLELALSDVECHSEANVLDGLLKTCDKLEREIKRAVERVIDAALSDQ